MWNELYNEAKEPTMNDIIEFINNPFFSELYTHIENTYNVKPKMEYSKCSAQPGWNIKYKKGGKTLCTFYPLQGYFIILVIIGNKEQQETEFIIPSLTPYTQELYSKTKFACGGRWLMIEIKEKSVFDDCLKLIDIRAKNK